MAAPFNSLLVGLNFVMVGGGKKEVVSTCMSSAFSRSGGLCLRRKPDILSKMLLLERANLCWSPPSATLGMLLALNKLLFLFSVLLAELDQDACA